MATELLSLSLLLATFASAAAEDPWKRRPAPPPAEDPLIEIAQLMHGAAGKLAEQRTDEPVQQRQQSILASLDRLIEQLEQQCSSCGSCSSGGQAANPAQQSTIRGGPGGEELHDTARGRHQLDNLPEEVRDRILQSRDDGFPPGYEALLQEYYRRLAEQRPADADSEKQPATEASAGDGERDKP